MPAKAGIFLKFFCIKQGSFSMYAVTYLLSEQEAGGGYFGHISVFLTKLGEERKLEVYPVYGYYGVPSTSDPDSFMGKFKKKFKLQLDFTGNHCLMILEKMKNLDKGCGLKGINFELTAEQFDAFFKKCKMKMKQELLAIEEGAKSLRIEEVAEKYKLYPQEKYSYQIFQYEKERARKNSEMPRLNDYCLAFKPNLSGSFFNESKNCKTGVVSLLKDTLPPEQINRLTQNGLYPVRPSRSGELEDILLHSSGPFSESKKGHKKVRKFGTGAKLYWTIPPQLIVRLPVSAFPAPIDKDLCVKIKEAARKLQGLEAIIRNATLNDVESPQQIEICRQNLIEKIAKCYEEFSFVEPRRNDLNSGRLFNDKDLETKRIINNLQKAEKLLQAIHTGLTNKTSKQDSINEPEKCLQYVSKKDKEKMLGLTRQLNRVAPMLSRL